MADLRPRLTWQYSLILLLFSANLSFIYAATNVNPLALRLRQEFNQVSAAIDTVVLVYGNETIKQVTKNATKSQVNYKTVLIFWADDEAVVYLNGQVVGSSRLTPKRIEIPAMYLQAQNVLGVHAWDTDRVESGFMAGLYVEDKKGLLHPVVLTGDNVWKSGNTRAEERFYTHPVPDIPGAKVIWGEALFGEVRFQAQFSLQKVRLAGAKKAVAPNTIKAISEPMEMHQVISRLTALEEQRSALMERLIKLEGGEAVAIYRGQVKSPLSYTLGKAASLKENQSIVTAKQVQQWTQTLSPVQLELVWQEGRRLKGIGAITVAKILEGRTQGKLDRRTDYQAPPETGRGQDGQRQIRGTTKSQGSTKTSVQIYPGMNTLYWTGWALILSLTLYLGGIGYQWWKVFSGKGWRY